MISARAETPPPQGSAEELAALRSLLLQLDYTEEGVCRHLGIRNIFEFQEKRPPNYTAEIHSAMDVLVRLFIATIPVEQSLAEKLLPPQSLELFRRTGFLKPDSCDPAAMLYPVRGLWLASDVLWKPDDPGSADLVFSAMTTIGGEYLNSLPPTPCEAFLELCGGSGVAALAAAREGASHTWSCDITERSTRFAEFNARLNELRNVTCLQGDMYQPVAGLSFDRIAVHPPYLPKLETKYVFRDGGEDGEQIVRAAIAGVPAFLRPGGTFYLTGLTSDRNGKRAEQRIRELLGEGHADFDVALVVIKSMAPADYCLFEVAESRATPEEASALEKRLLALEIEQLVYGWCIIRRHAIKREPFTARRPSNDRVGWRELSWLIETEALWSDSAVYAGAWDTHPLPGPNVECFVTRRYSGGGWKDISCTMRTEYPFKVEISGPPWLAHMAEICDGRRTVGDVAQMLVDGGLIGANPPPMEFLRFLRPFATAGLFRFQ